MFCAILVKADGDHLAVPNCTKSKWLNAKITVAQTGTIPLQDFFQFYTLLFFSKGCYLDRPFSNLIWKQLNASIILKQIWSKSIKRLLRYCHFHVLHYNGSHLGMQNCKKFKQLYTANILAQSWININQ